MARRAKIDLVIGEIGKFFLKDTKMVYSNEELRGTLFENQNEWGLPASIQFEKFKDKLLSENILSLLEIELKDSQELPIKIYERFYSKKLNPFLIAASITSKSYFSHYSAMVIHGLTEQIPKTVYITKEQSQRVEVLNSLTQSGIDIAFSKPQRVPSKYYQYKRHKFLLLSGKYTNKAGVQRIDSIFGKNINVTNLERTLIDIVVRPDYSGGVTEVIKAFDKAAQHISVNKLKAMLTKLNFLYPYHQAIGFYLEKSGQYTQAQINLMLDIEQKFDFYLTYDMTEKTYDETWKIFYPSDL